MCFYRVVRYIQGMKLVHKIVRMLTHPGLKILYCVGNGFQIRTNGICAVRNTPVTISGNLASDPPGSISQHQSGCCGIIQIPETYFMFTCIIPNRQGRDDQSAIKGKAAEGNQGFYRVFDKVIPGFQAVKNFRYKETKDGAQYDNIPYPVMRPDADFPLLRLG